MIQVTLLALILLAGQAEAGDAPRMAGVPGAGASDGPSVFGWGGVTAFFGAVVLAGGGFLLAWLNNGKRLMGQIDQLNDRTFKLVHDLMGCKMEHAQALIRETQFKADLERTQLRVETLEKATGVTYPVPMVGVIIANKDALILEYSPTLTVNFGWAPEEMRGQPLEKMVPEERREDFRARFARDVDPAVALDPLKKHNTYLCDKTGRSVPVTLSVRRWPGPEGMMTITITVRPPPTSTLVVNAAQPLADTDF